MANHSINIVMSNSGAKVLEVSKIKEQLLVTACASVNYDVNNQKSKIKDVVQHVLASKASTEKLISTSIWMPSVIVRRIQMPVMTQSELRTAIKFEFEKHIPFSVDECFLDYYIIRKLPSNERMEVMLVSAKKESIESKRRVFADSNWDLNFIDIHPFAICNLYSYLHGKSQMKSTALIHIDDISGFSMPGPNFISVIKDAHPFIVRDLGEEKVTSENEIGDEPIDRITDGIQKSIEFYENTAEETIEDIYLTGNGIKSEKLIKRFENALEIKIKILSVKDKIEFSTPACKDTFERNEQDYLIPMGLAIRGLKS